MKPWNPSSRHKDQKPPVPAKFLITASGAPSSPGEARHRDHEIRGLPDSPGRVVFQFCLPEEFVGTPQKGGRSFSPSASREAFPLPKETSLFKGGRLTGLILSSSML